MTKPFQNKQEWRLTLKYPGPPRSEYGTLVVSWNWRTVEQCRWWFCLIQIKPLSSRGPIPLWQWILHVHWYRDCETVPERRWNKSMTVSPPQCKQISFGIKNESEVQCQPSPRLIRILTVLKCSCGNPNLNRWGVMVWTNSKRGQLFWVWS